MWGSILTFLQLVFTVWLNHITAKHEKDKEVAKKKEDLENEAIDAIKRGDIAKQLDILNRLRELG